MRRPRTCWVVCDFRVQGSQVVLPGIISENLTLGFKLSQPKRVINVLNNQEADPNVSLRVPAPWSLETPGNQYVHVLNNPNPTTDILRSMRSGTHTPPQAPVPITHKKGCALWRTGSEGITGRHTPQRQNRKVRHDRRRTVKHRPPRANVR